MTLPDYDGTYRSLLPAAYDYNKIYTQLEQQAQRESYPLSYKHHIGEKEWDFKFGRMSAEDFAQVHYYDALDVLLAACEARSTMAQKLQAEQEALDAQVERYQTEKDNCVKFMQEFIRRKGQPRNGYTPVNLQPVGNDTRIAMGRAQVFDDIISPQPSKRFAPFSPYDGKSYLTRLPLEYDYQKIWNQLKMMPVYLDPKKNPDFAKWDGYYAAEYFFYCHYLHPSAEIELCDIQAENAKTEKEKTKLFSRKSRCEIDQEHCIHFMRDYQAGYRNFFPQDQTYTEFGTYEIFVSILKQLHFGTDPYHVRSRWSKDSGWYPEKNPEDGETIWSIYSIDVEVIYVDK